MKPELSAELIKGYLNNNCTEAEGALVEDWYNSFDNTSDLSLSNEEKRELRSKLFNKIISDPCFEEQAESNKRKTTRTIYRTITALSGVAAAILLIFNALFYDKESKVIVESYKSANLPFAKTVNYSKNIVRTILPDNSVVWLSPNSSLEYPNKFSGDLREVKMKGEAFFEVTKDHAHPFIIYSGGVITRVWGTSFLIKAYESKPTEVSVVTGKVSVSIPKRAKSEVMLFPTQKVIYLKDEDKLKKDLEKKISTVHMWEKATMSFENKPVSEVIDVLNKEFKTQINAGGDKELEGYVLNADFNDMNLASVLEIMGKSLNVDYEISNEIILIKRKTNN